jgi:hypothetical protein
MSDASALHQRVRSRTGVRVPAFALAQAALAHIYTEMAP